MHRGTQPALNRDVAVKVVRSELANRPEFVRGFEAEAAIIARLEHPHIVPLYDFWREPDRACLVMRWLTGGSLETQLDAGPMSLEDTAQMVEQVGSALAMAHRAGVVHRDVKSANILLDEEGNAYLTDFGIAVEATGDENPAAALSEGSPAYASPEQLRREVVGPAADVHGLGIAVYETLTGHLPFPETEDEAALLRHQLHDPIPPPSLSRPELSASVDEVLARATAKDPRGRYDQVGDFVSEFTAALAESASAPPAVYTAARRAVHTSAIVDNPYRGLRAFGEADARDFHGRDRLIDELLERMIDAQAPSNFLAVVGASGSGKSSVVRAGLLPALRQGRLPGSEGWFFTTMTPGPHPYEALETALLRVAVNPPASLIEQLREERRGIIRGVGRILPDDESTVLLVIDQFEEVFTLCADQETRSRFLEALAVAVDAPGSALRLVVVLRADFYDQPLGYESFADLVKHHAVTVTPLAPDELEQAIVRPAEQASATFEPGLVAEILADVSSQPGSLPLMQYALTELFERRVDGTLKVEAYRELGGLSGALARRADDLYRALERAHERAARRLFGRLITLGQGSDDTRRRVTRTELGPDPATAACIDAFGRARLLSFDRDPLTREPVVELSHEALIREWPRLREWLEHDRANLRIHRDITDGATRWLAGGREETDVLRGGRLEMALNYRADHPDELNADEAAFLDAAVELRDADAERTRRGNRRFRRLAAAASAVAVVAVVAGLAAWQGQRQVVRERDAAEAARTVAEDRALEAAAERDAAGEARAAGETARIASEASTHARPRTRSWHSSWLSRPTIGTLGQQRCRSSSEPCCAQARWSRSWAGPIGATAPCAGSMAVPGSLRPTLRASTFSTPRPMRSCGARSPPDLDRSEASGRLLRARTP